MYDVIKNSSPLQRHTRAQTCRRISFGNPMLVMSALALFSFGATTVIGQGVGGDQGDVAPTSAQGQLDIPGNVVMLGEENPNVRRPTAVINGDIITETDVSQRLALVLVNNNGQVPPDQLTQLRLQILRNLIDEKLEIQDAKNDKVTVDDADVDQSYARVATSNFHQPPAALDAYLIKIGSSAASLKQQIRAELAWQRVIHSDVQPFINVSDSEVNDVLARLKAEKGATQYHIGEIFLSATPDNSATVEQTAQQIVDQIHKGGSFVAYARQYSEASTAAVGGDLGWVQPGQLPAEIRDAVKDMTAGQIAGPIALRGGFDIINMIDRRRLLTADPRDAILSLKQISITPPAGIPDAELTQLAGKLATALKQAKGCGSVDAIATKAGAQVVTNDQVSARNLPAPLQTALLKMSPGDMTPPFGSVQDGIRVLMLCGRDDPKIDNTPSFDSIMSKMEDDRVNRRAQMLLRDLRRDAIIDYN